MTVTLTAPVEGKQPGDTYTGANEAFLLAEGYATQAAYVGPGVANTGPATSNVASQNAAHSERAQRAVTSDLPQGGTNDGIVTAPPDAPELHYTGSDGPAPEVTPYANFDGFANEPAAGYPLVVSTVTKADGTAATGLATAGGASLRVKGRGFREVTKFQVEGTDATALVKLSDQEATFTAPAKAAGTYDVVAFRADGNVTKVDAVVYA